MNATLVFVHGRRQEFKDPDELKRKWLAGLASGLAKAGLKTGPVVDTNPVVFPFYANLLYGITRNLARNPLELESMTDNFDDAAPLHPYMPQDVGILERQLLQDMRVSAEASGMASIEGAATADAGRIELESLSERVLAWGVTRRVLTALSRHTRVDQEIISSYLRDVAVYLAKARGDIFEMVKEAIPDDGPIVLVSHSLGTVVACDLLSDQNLCQRTKLWVTAGSPLGLDAVFKNLQPPGPRNIDVDWLTTYDVSDIVALGHPLLQTRGWGSVQNIKVDNGDEPHSIERYLGHPEVAGKIGVALGA
ncbi:hypothetical protein [Streptomyces sp. NPDC000878]